MSDRCSTCKAPVIWALSENGKRMPIDPESTEGGTIVLSHQRVGEPPVALVKSIDEIEALRQQHARSPQDGPLRLFSCHFATCPDAGAHRRARQQKVTAAETAGSPVGMAMSIAERREANQRERQALIDDGFTPTGRECRECGCCDEIACAEGCWWAERDLCSLCAEELGKA